MKPGFAEDVNEAGRGGGLGAGQGRARVWPPDRGARASLRSARSAPARRSASNARAARPPPPTVLPFPPCGTTLHAGEGRPSATGVRGGRPMTVTGSMFERYGGFARVSKVVMAFLRPGARFRPAVGVFSRTSTCAGLIDHQTKFIASTMGGPGGVHRRAAAARCMPILGSRSRRLRRDDPDSGRDARGVRLRTGGRRDGDPRDRGRLAAADRRAAAGRADGRAADGRGAWISRNLQRDAGRRRGRRAGGGAGGRPGAGSSTTADLPNGSPTSLGPGPGRGGPGAGRGGPGGGPGGGRGRRPRRSPRGLAALMPRLDRAPRSRAASGGRSGLTGSRSRPGCGRRSVTLAVGLSRR